MDQEFINAYIEKLAKKWEESQKQILLLETHLELVQTKFGDLQIEHQKLIDKLNKLETGLNKKSKQKEVYTSEETF